MAFIIECTMHVQTIDRQRQRHFNWFRSDDMQMTLMFEITEVYAFELFSFFILNVITICGVIKNYAI